MLVGLTLAVMFIVTLISLIAGNSFSSLFIENIVDTTEIINGSTDFWGNPINDAMFGLDPITGGIALILVLSIIGGAIGIQFLGSGLSEGSVRIILLAIFYGGLWAILSLLSYPLIIAIEVFGVLIYLTLTILYAIGVVSKYFGGGEGS